MAMLRPCPRLPVETGIGERVPLEGCDWSLEVGFENSLRSSSSPMRPIVERRV